MINEIGFGVSATNWRVRFGLRFNEGCPLLPGVEESGGAVPPQYFDYGSSDSYWKWSWLWLCVFFARVTP